MMFLFTTAHFTGDIKCRMNKMPKRGKRGHDGYDGLPGVPGPVGPTGPTGLSSLNITGNTGVIASPNPITTSGSLSIDSNYVAIVSGSLSPSQIYQLASNPPILIPAPAGNQIIVINKAIFAFSNLTIQYQGGAGGNTQLEYGNLQGLIAASTPIANSFITSAILDDMIQVTGTVSLFTGDSVGLPVSLVNEGVDFTTGNGTLNYWISYYLITGVSE